MSIDIAFAAFMLVMLVMLHLLERGVIALEAIARAVTKPAATEGQSE